MILLEYCDLGSLLDWLKKIVKVTGDVEEQMNMFTVQSAKGMQHLHDKGILHRRLGVRNVLLQTDLMTNQIRAKLSGFGPLKGEHEGAQHKKDRIPIKWMAPEQFDKADGEKRHYSKATDMWSFGILVWEIFMKGAGPYPKYPKLPEMKAAIMKGYRMEKPHDCSKYMFDEVITPSWNTDPNVRPDFDTLVAKLEHEYGAQGGDIYDYDPANPANPASSMALYSNEKNSFAMQVD